MKKLNIKSFVLGMLVMAIVMSTAAPAVASTMKAAQLYYNNIKIRLNGEELVPKDALGNIVEPFAIEGTTYLPIRAISSALGLNVTWDGATQTVVLGNDPEYNQPAKWLGDMSAFAGQAYINRDTYEQYHTANNGEKFENFMKFGTEEATYLLNGEYTRFTGTFYLCDGHKNDNFNSIRFNIYVDGKLAYQSEPIFQGHTPEEFEIDVTDAYKLEIKIEGRQENPVQGEWFKSSTYSKGAFIGNAALWND